jgi:hypothetical protein
MSGPSVFKVTEKIGPIGWLAKEPIDHREFYLDFSRWLASNETIVSVSQYATVNSPDPCIGGWSVAYGPGCSCACPGNGDDDPPTPPLPYAFDGSKTLGLTPPAYLFDGATPGEGYEISNPHPSDELWISDSTTAAPGKAGCYRVPPGGGTYVTPEEYRPLGPVSVYWTLPGHRVTARGWGSGVPMAPVDLYPLYVAMATVEAGGKRAVMLIGGGCAGMTYGLSVLAEAQPTQRRKIIDLLVCIGVPMVELRLPEPLPPPPFLYVKGSINLPIGTVGSVYVQNEAGSSITIGLPALPNVDDDLVIKDIVGNADTYNIVIQSVDGSMIDGQSFYVIMFKYGALHIKWTGTKWNIL